MSRPRRFALTLWQALRRRLTAMQVVALILAAGIGGMLQRGQWPWVLLVLPALALVLAVDDREETR